MTGLWAVGAAMRAALASLDFFASVFYQEKIEGPAGEAKDRLKKEYQINKKYIILEMHQVIPRMLASR